jgi:GNAT superfamily N-acetyltransferase
MQNKNLVRMIRLAEEIFDAQNDPDQILVDEHVIARLKKIHPASMSQKSTRDGPIAWGLVLPTSHRLMDLFLANTISERELLKRTHAGNTYDAAYLCSVLVLPEYRGKGIARRLITDSIKSIQHQHPLQSLFCWPFSTAGEQLAEVIAAKLHLPLYKKTT